MTSGGHFQTEPFWDILKDLDLETEILQRLKMLSNNKKILLFKTINVFLKEKTQSQMYEKNNPQKKSLLVFRQLQNFVTLKKRQTSVAEVALREDLNLEIKIKTNSSHGTLFKFKPIDCLWLKIKPKPQNYNKLPQVTETKKIA